MRTNNPSSLLDQLCSLLRPGVSRKDAIIIARAEVIRRGYHWKEPVIVSRGWHSYHFWTNSLFAGGNLSVTVRKRGSGAIEVVIRNPGSRQGDRGYNPQRSEWHEKEGEFVWIKDL